MDSYDSELERTVKAFQLLPRKLSEENVRMLGNLNHFETFDEDNIEISPGVKGKRISLSGSIVVLDIDFVAEPNVAGNTQSVPATPSATSRGQTVTNASIYLSNDTPKDAPYSAMSAVNNPSAHVLASLKEPRLDSFGKILGVLSKCDRFSTKDIDCFKALGLVAEAIFLQQKIRPDVAREYGQLIVNPKQSLGLAFDYIPELKVNPEMTYYAFLDISPGSRPQYCLRDFTQVSDWIDTETGHWISHSSPSKAEARAELCLTMDPPIYISDQIAIQLDAEIASTVCELDERKQASSFNVPRHPRFASPSNMSDDFDILVGNMLPFQLVTVSQIPLRSPEQIVDVLAILRQFGLTTTLIKSVLKGGEPAPTNEAAELNIADALELRNQPVHYKHIPLSISWRCVGDDLEIDVVWTVSDLELLIVLPRKGDVRVTVVPDNVQLNMADVEKLVKSGNLDLAFSYAVASAGRLHRRSTTSF